MTSPSIKNFVCCSRKFKCMCMFLSTGIGALSLSTKSHNSGSPDILDFLRPNWIFLFPKKEPNTNLASLSLSTSKVQFSKLQDIHLISPTRLRTMTWTNVFLAKRIVYQFRQRLPMPRVVWSCKVSFMLRKTTKAIHINTKLRWTKHACLQLPLQIRPCKALP